MKSATQCWMSWHIFCHRCLEVAAGNLILSISFCTGMFYIDCYYFNDVLMLSKLLKCICFPPLTLGLESYYIPLQQFWDRSKDQTTDLHWEFEEHNTTILHCEDWQNDHFCGQDIIGVHHRFILSSLSKTGASNIETPHSLPFKTDIPTYCVASFVAQMYSSNTTIVDVTRSITSQLVHSYNIYKSDCHWEQFQNMCLNVCLN